MLLCFDPQGRALQMLIEEKKELNIHSQVMYGSWKLSLLHTQDKYSNTVMLDKQDMIMKMYWSRQWYEDRHVKLD